MPKARIRLQAEADGGGSGALNMGTLHGGMPIGVVAHPLQMALER